uniref:Uncharacterized protein n=1 Tax=viral metagenome TaxID=1070528 RepID=A0A6M3IFR1_9ZZZZ
MKKGDIIEVRLNKKGYVKAELIKENHETVIVRLLHDNHTIERSKKRDLKND